MAKPILSQQNKKSAVPPKGAEPRNSGPRKGRSAGQYAGLPSGKKLWRDSTARRSDFQEKIYIKFFNKEKKWL